MRLYLINANWGGGGPAGVANDIYDIATENGYDCRFAYSRGSAPASMNAYRFGSTPAVYLHAACSRVFDNAGFMSARATRSLIDDIERFHPDVINLHNQLGYTLHVGVLFEYFKTCNTPIVWTLHDCWPITGHCITGVCERLVDGCGDCPNKRQFPKSYVLDRSVANLQKKKAIFSGLQNLTLVTPSQWLGSLVGKSFLGEYPLHVIPNGVDLDVFHPVESDLRERYGIGGRKLLLAVAGVWTAQKGGAYFLELASRLDESYVLVMIGKDKCGLKANGDRMIILDHTESREELVEWYSAADVFVNPTLGDNFPTVNIEALACGSKIITFRTGGSPESVGDCGIVVDQGNLDGLIEAIYAIESLGISRSHCVKRAAKYDKKIAYDAYMSLFEMQNSRNKC